MNVAQAVVDPRDGSVLVRVADLDSLEAGEAAELLRSCCPSRRWVTEVVSGRPYGGMRQLIAASADVLADLSWSDVVQALAAEPRRVVRAAAHDDPAGVERESARAELRELVRLKLITTFR